MIQRVHVFESPNLLRRGLLRSAHALPNSEGVALIGIHLEELRPHLLARQIRQAQNYLGWICGLTVVW
jgi:hypothetical protein